MRTSCRTVRLWLSSTALTAVVLGTAMPAFAQSQDALNSQIEAELKAFEQHVQGLESTPGPEGSQRAVQEAIQRLGGGGASASKTVIEDSVRRAARGWIASDTPPIASVPVDPALITPVEPPTPGPAPKIANPISPKDQTADVLVAENLASLGAVAPLAAPGRVLTLPGGQVISRGAREEQPAFTVLYNHGKALVGAQRTEYVAVGSTRTSFDGWIAKDQTEEWRSMLVMQYAPLSGRERVIFFNQPEDIKEVLNSHFSGSDDARALYRQVDSKQFDNSRIVAIEPEKAVAGDERPYLMPILSFQRDRFDDVPETPVFLLELAAVNLQSRTRTEEDVVGAPKTSVNASEAVKDLRIGVVFVVDATVSMGPYIQEVQKFLRNMYAEGSRIAPGQIDFGLLGYRDNTSVNKEIGYVTNQFLPLGVTGVGQFESAVSQIVPSKVSTRNWREDAFAGLQDAIERTDWTDYDARFIVLVTDAGPRVVGDALARDQTLGARSVGRMAQRRNVTLTIMHALTDAGKKNHQAAKNHYGEVAAALGDSAPRYFTLPSNSPKIFGDSLNYVGQGLLRQLRDLNGGTVLTRSTRFSDDPITADLLGSAVSIETEQDSARVGKVFTDQIFAYQQEYLGKLEGGEAPDFYRAWVSDRDLVNPTVNSMQVKVLMTRDQMSDLSARLGTIVSQLDNKEKGTQDAFRGIADLAGVTAYDPSLPVSQLLPEYLADLPYGSRFMTMTAPVWAGLGGQQQDEILNEVRDRIQLLERINASQADWLQLPGRSTSDELYPLALDDLP